MVELWLGWGFDNRAGRALLGFLLLWSYLSAKAKQPRIRMSSISRISTILRFEEIQKTRFNNNLYLNLLGTLGRTFSYFTWMSMAFSTLLDSVSCIVNWVNNNGVLIF